MILSRHDSVQSGKRPLRKSPPHSSVFAFFSAIVVTTVYKKEAALADGFCGLKLY